MVNYSAVLDFITLSTVFLLSGLSFLLYSIAFQAITSSEHILKAPGFKMCVGGML